MFSLATNWAHFASLLLTFEALAALFFVMFVHAFECAGGLVLYLVVVVSAAVFGASLLIVHVGRFGSDFAYVVGLAYLSALLKPVRFV